MKKTVFTLFLLILFLFILCYPSEAVNASRNGLNLWLNSLLPSLLPFIILTNLLVQNTFVSTIPSHWRHFIRYAFGLSPWGLYCLFLGMLCGFPMGAKISSDFYSSGKISKREAQYLLTISNQPSPAFLITYLCHTIFRKHELYKNVLCMFYLSVLSCMFFFRFIIYRNHTIASDFLPSSAGKGTHKKETPTYSSTGAIIDVSIMNGFETITRLGGYILLFSIISATIVHFWPFADVSSIFVSGPTELITGLNQLAASGYPFKIQYFLSLLLTSFGGCCVLFQTKSVLNSELKILPYLFAKVIQTIFLFFWLLVF